MWLKVGVNRIILLQYNGSQVFSLCSWNNFNPSVCDLKSRGLHLRISSLSPSLATVHSRVAMMLSDALVAVMALVTAVCAAPTSTSQPIPPKQDPWYSAPAGWENAAPGDVLRSRPAPGNLTEVVGNCSAAHNILFRTTDSNGNPTWAVTTLFTPEPLVMSACDMPPKSFGALLSYQIPYDSADLNDSPSFQLYDEPPADISDALARRWFVNVPDFEGPLASFTAGVMSGHATLDSVRAVRSASLGVAENARYAMWGYSGGALASEWASELQPSYAPELNFAGAALGGLTPNVTSVMMACNGQLEAGLIPEGNVGLVTQHPPASKVLMSSLKSSGPHNKTGFLVVRDITFDQAVLQYAGQDIASYFTDGFGFLENPAVQKAISADGLMGYHGVPKMPIFAYKAIGDEVSPIADSDNLVTKLCNSGASISYQRNSVGGHVAEATNGEASATDFLESVLSGTYHTKGCQVHNVTIAISTTPERRRWAPNTSNRLR